MTLELLRRTPSFKSIAERAFAACTPRAPLEPLPSEFGTDPSRARIVCISDTHDHHDSLPPLPPGDILIHAGDLTSTGDIHHVRAALAWLAAAPHPHKIVVPGNHDHALLAPSTRATLLARFPSLICLLDASAVLTIRGRRLSVYGSPRTVFPDPPSAPSVWPIPPHTDVLVTHGPPAGHLDGADHIGSAQLLHAARRVRPRLHVFGHVHRGRGVRYLNWSWTQRVYDRPYLTGAPRPRRWTDAVLLVAVALATKLVGRPRFRPDQDTIMVNAACLAGYRNDLERDVREAVVVDMDLPDPPW